MEKSNVLFERLTPETADKVRQNRGKGGFFKALRRDPDKDIATSLRPAFVRDVEKILNSAYYNRLSDKTQVLSFYRNDDITRRALHVQLVSRITRTVGGALGLDLDLIEAIAIGHDIGHTPFGHAGEAILDGLLKETVGLRFNHNVQSVRVLDTVFGYNLTLETLDGILCHNGEMPSASYRPRSDYSFERFDADIQKCMHDSLHIKSLVPVTKEGCLVRVCDMIAYLGKDRQDYERAGLGKESDFPGELPNNSQIINNLCVSIVENSIDSDGIHLDAEHFKLLKGLKETNYSAIYLTDDVRKHYDDTIAPMMRRIFYKLLGDFKSGDRDSLIYRHHVDFIDGKLAYKGGAAEYLKQPPELIVADYIASMTDSYFLELYAHLFGIRTHGYFD